MPTSEDRRRTCESRPRIVRSQSWRSARVTRTSGTVAIAGGLLALVLAPIMVIIVTG